MIRFLKIEDFLAPPPLPAIIAILMALGIKFLGARLLRALKPGLAEPLESATGFVIAASLVAAAVHFLSFLGVAYLWPLRAMAWSLLALGTWELAGWPWGRLFHNYQQIKGFFSQQPFWARAAMLLLAITVTGLFLSALGPPTDADSLDYHLGVPLDILRHHGAYPRPDWLHARLTGLGESLNMLGLAGGTDVFGAVLQFAGMLVAWAAIYSFAGTDSDRILLSLCVIGTPVMAFLVPNQKPQMLPVAASTVALTLIVQRFRAITPVTLVLAFCCVFFAISCKYSFLLSGAVVLAAGFLAAYRAGLLGLGIGVSLVAYLVLAFPGHLQNYLFYGDPLSPLLERFRGGGDAAAIGFAAYLRAYPGIGKSFLPSPLNLLVPLSPRDLTTVLGLGSLLFFVAVKELRKNYVARIFLISALAAAVAILAFGQVGARYFLEPYLWTVAAAAAAPWRGLKTLVCKIMTCQILVLSLIAGVGAVTLFPGALTSSWRHKVMTKSAACYSETRWLDDALPADAIVLGEIRSAALMPRPSLSKDAFFFLNYPSDIGKLMSMIRSSHANVIVMSFPISEKINRYLGASLGERLAGPEEFRAAFRNPFKLGPVTRLVAYRLNNDPWQHNQK